VAPAFARVDLEEVAWENLLPVILAILAAIP
jgi:hypothetical protein